MAAGTNAQFITASDINSCVLAVNDFLAANAGWNAAESPRFYQGIGWAVLVTKPT